MKFLKDRTEWPPIAVYDIETTEWINVTLVCHIDELGNRVHFDSIEKYVSWLGTYFTGSHLWAHFGGRFDHRFIIPEVKKRGWDFKVCMSGGSIVIMFLNTGKKKIAFCDSFRLMPNSLKMIGKTVGLQKLDVDRTKMEILTPEQTLEYCYRDCEIALKGLQHMRDALTSVNADFACTLASVASRWVRRTDAINWKRLALQDEIATQVDNFCEPAYFGGRAEMFKRGTFQGPIYYYDIVSSYPASMRNELPLYFKGYFQAPKSQRQDKIEEYLSYPGITEAYVDLPVNRHVMPLCIRYNGRLVFPYGNNIGRQEHLPHPSKCHECHTAMKTHVCKICKRVYPKRNLVAGRWTNIELLAALKRGAIIRPIIQARFEGAPFLGNFVSTFYGLRKKAKEDKDAFRTYAYKILLNSLYGKLVETVDRTAYVTTPPTELQEGSKLSQTDIAGLHCLKSKEEGPFRHVAAGAYVTAYSRLNLLKGLEAAMSVPGGEVYYCDTDSIMTNVRLDHMQGSELGQWNLEHIFDSVELVLPKVYKAKIRGGETIYRCKGMPMVRDGDEPGTSERRWEAFKSYSETKDPEQEVLLNRSGLTGFVADINVGSISPRSTNLLRSLKGEDMKREWSGGESAPIYIEGE